MAKSADAFRTISEVADWLETPAHVLRFWESKFSQVKPVKRAGGRRYYRPADMKLLGGIKKLLHDDGMTIKGVQKLLREQGVAHVAGFSQPLGDAADDVIIEHVEDAVPSASVAPQPPATRPETSADRGEAGQPSPELNPEPQPEDDAPLTAKRETAEQEESEAEAEPPQTPEEDSPTLPSFRHRRQAGSPSTAPVQDKAPSSDISNEQVVPTEPPKPRQIDVDVPADPDDAVDADPGVLSMLSRLPRPLSSDTADRLENLVSRLRAATGSATKD